MLDRFRSHLTYANVASTLALVIAVAGGTAYAANTIFSTDIVNGEVKSVDLGNRAVTNAKLADGSVDSDTVVDESLGSRDLRNNAAVQSPDVRNESLSGADIAGESLTGGDIADGSVGSGDVADGSISGREIQDESLGGDDVSEPTLGEVPSAKIGGFGRWTGGGSCDPEDLNYVDCAIVTLNLPQPARVLLIGQVSAGREIDADIGVGNCELVSNAGRIVPNSQTRVNTHEFFENVALTAVTGVQAAGSHDYAVDCNQSEQIGAIDYVYAGISAVALSPD